MVNPLGYFTRDGKARPIFARRPKSYLPPASSKKVLPKHSSIYAERLANVAKLSTSFAMNKAKEFQENQKLREQLAQQSKMQEEKNVTKSKEQVEAEERRQIENRKPISSNYDIFKGGGMFVGNDVQESPLKTEEPDQLSKKEIQERNKEDAIRFKLLQSSGGRARLGVQPQH